VKNGTSGFEFDHWMQSSPDTLLVYMRGQMVYETLDATDGCWQAVQHAFRRSVLLDFSQVTYMASAALGSRFPQSAGQRVHSKTSGLPADSKQCLAI
jgi:hypothetical protein